MQHHWNRLRKSQKSNLIALGFVVATVLIAQLLYGLVREVSYKRKCAEVKQNLHAIQLAVERYSVDHPESSYPRDIREVKTRGYLPEFPTNPFTGLPMRCVE